MRNIFKIFLTVIVAGVQSFGQELHNKGATISIKPNTTLSVGEDLTNNGEIINNGKIELKGSWINSGSYQPGSGELALLGSSQSIDHRGQSLAKLTVSGGGIKSVNSNFRIETELSFIDGILFSNNNSQVIFGTTSTFSGASDLSFVWGAVVHYGVGNKVFPVGMNNTYLPAELVNVTGENPEIAISLSQPGSDLQPDETLSQLSQSEIWELNVLSGTYSGSQIKLPISDPSFLDPSENVVIAQATGLETLFSSIGQSELEANGNRGTIVSELPATSSIFTIGRINTTPPPTVTSLDEALLAEQINIFPNPSSDQFEVSLDHPITGNIVFSIIDMNGRLVSQFQFRKHQHSFRDRIKHQLNPGSYFLKASIEKYHITKRLLVVQ